MESIFEMICLKSINEALSSNSLLHTPGKMNGTQLGGCNISSETDSGQYYSVFMQVLIVICASIASFVTIVGNVLVMVSFKVDKRLQTVNNYFLLSLAGADLMIGLISVPLFTAYTLQQDWKLGHIICDSWLSLDYLCSNASVLILLIISLDRYFSITRPLQYRAQRSSKEAAMVIAVAWIISFLLWPTWIFSWPYIEGQRTVPENKCYIPFLEKNTSITVVTTLISFYIPIIWMCFLNHKIWRETEKIKYFLAKLIADNEQSTEQTAACLPSAALLADIEGKKSWIHRVKDFQISLCNVDCDDAGDDDSGSSGGTTPSSAETPIQSSRATSVTLRPEQSTCLQAMMISDEESTRALTKESLCTTMIILPDLSDPGVNHQPSVTSIPNELTPVSPAPMRSSLSYSSLMDHSVADHHLTRCSSIEVLSVSRLNEAGRPVRTQRLNAREIHNRAQEIKHEQKTASILSAILLAFIITRTPHNVLLLVKSIESLISCSDVIPQGVWDFSYFLCYINSMLNPLCYALVNANFRKTYWRILTGTWRNKSKLSIIRGLHSRASRHKVDRSNHFNFSSCSGNCSQQMQVLQRPEYRTVRIEVSSIAGNISYLCTRC